MDAADEGLSRTGIRRDKGAGTPPPGLFAFPRPGRRRGNKRRIRIVNGTGAQSGKSCLRKTPTGKPPRAGFLALTLMLFLTTAASSLPDAAETAEGVLDAEITLREDYTIVVDGREAVSDVPPVERGGIIHIPMRFAAEALKAQVDWLPAEKTVVIRKGERTASMRIGDPRVTTSEGEKHLVCAPFIFEQRTMIPLRAAAEALHFRVEEKPGAMFLASPAEADLFPFTGEVAEAPGIGKEPVDYGKIYAIFRAQAKRDAATRAIRPYVLAAWAAAALLWLARTAGAFRRKEKEYRDKILIAIILFGATPFILYGPVILSTYWAAVVAVGTSIAGLMSTEDYSEKLVTMANSAMGLGLICTLFGLGLVIGPAIATHNIAAIGYGIYVKIEPTITGLAVSYFMNVLYGYEARKLRQE
ncbi:MAG: copper amine oxidase N-terminal domain-containing protein [bacterium]